MPSTVQLTQNKKSDPYADFWNSHTTLTDKENQFSEDDFFFFDK
jgi:hypothetical protein